MKNIFDETFKNSIELKSKCIEVGFFELVEIGNAIVESLTNKKKLLLCGNGGSAADAQHLAAEMLVRLRPTFNRDAIPALALAQDTSTITACGNDYSFDNLFSRNLEAIGNEGDCLIAISTSGNSKNIIEAMKVAREKKIMVIGFLGCDGGKALSYCDKAYVVPSYETGRIQEVHITAGHALMEYVEDALLENGQINLKK